MMLVVIGGSSGSIDALRALLRPISAMVQATFVVVVHVSPKHPSLLVQVLQSYSSLAICEAVDKMPLERGVLVVAPPDYHVLVERGLTLALSRDREQHYSRPAIDPLFETAADAAGADVVGVLLTGGNQDGAAGLRAIKAAGGQVAIQDPVTATSPEMPNAGLAACAPPGPDLVATPRAIGQWIATLATSKEHG